MKNITSSLLFQTFLLIIFTIFTTSTIVTFAQYKEYEFERHSKSCDSTIIYDSYGKCLI